MEDKAKNKHIAPRKAPRKWLKTDVVALCLTAGIASFWYFRDTGFGFWRGMVIFLLLGLPLGFTAHRDYAIPGMILIGGAVGLAFTVHGDKFMGFVLIGVLLASGYIVAEQANYGTRK